MTFTVIDLETESIEYLGRKASPYCADNYIVAPGWSHGADAVQHLYFNSKDEAEAVDWLEPVLKDTTVLVAHNATFEMEWFLSRHRSTFLSYLKRGGRVFCTQYAEYLLSHQTEIYPALEDVAVKYGGTKKIDEVKLLWEQGVLTSKIERDLLISYLAGSSGDIENTRLVAFQQYAELKQRGMLDMFWLRMDSLVFNALCVSNGLHVNMETAKRNHAKQLERADEIRTEISKMLPSNLPEEFEFNYGSSFHLSAFLFGGPVPYKTKVSYEPKKFEKLDCYEVGSTYIAVDKILPEQMLNVTLYKSGKNKGTPKVFRVDSDVEKLKWADAVYHFKGLIDFSDLPSHVSEEYTGRRASYRGKQTLCDNETPVYSTGKDSLDLLANFVGFAKPLKELAKLDKDNGTYYIKHTYNKDGSIKKSQGMLQYVGADGIIHHRLNSCATITSRLSSSDPNLQNLPRDGTSSVKEMFDSRFPEGKIVETDYTALEVVDIAAASGDFNLLEKLLAGTDMHCYRLAGAKGVWNGLTYEDLVRINDDKSDPRHTEVHEARTNIKPKAFSAQYGATAMGISFSTGCSLEEAQEFLDNEAALFPESTAFKQKVREVVELTGESPEALCREVNDLGFWSIYRRGHYRAPGGTCYSFRQYKKRVNGTEVMDYKDTEMSNYPIQGESAFIVQAACGRVMRWLVQSDLLDFIVPINTVHDAIYTDNINEEWAKYAGRMIKHIMEDTPKYIAEVIPAYKEWNYHTTPFPAVPEFGDNMMNKEHC